MAIQTINLPDGMDLNDFSAAVRHINRAAVKGVEGRPNFICVWDDSIAPAPTEAEIKTAASEVQAESQEKDTKATSAKDTLINNASVIKQAMGGVGDARDALDEVIPIDTTNQTTIIDTLARRQAAVLFLAANALRASMMIADGRKLPQELIDEFF